MPAFQISKYEVTVGQYRQFVAATGYQSPNPFCAKLATGPNGFDNGTFGWDSVPFAQTDFHPVTCVSDVDAMMYASWLQQNTGKAYRLPSEAEWEYAARGGAATIREYADMSQFCRYANRRDNTAAATLNPLTLGRGVNLNCTDNAIYTSVVGMYEANAYGVYDLLGNINEILGDCEHLGMPSAAPANGSAWTTNCTVPSARLTRGGGYYTGAGAPDRNHSGYFSHAAMEGFRLALSTAVTPATPATVEFEAALERARAAERLRR